MLYNIIKIFHIVAAAGALTSMAYSAYLMWAYPLPKVRERIHLQTVFFILPFFFLQLLSGFTLISLNYADFSRFWMEASVLSFIAVVLSWLAFIYCTLSLEHARRLPYFFIVGVRRLFVMFIIFYGK